jgi:hypothetical protein
MPSDWQGCRFLESTDNLKRVLKMRTGRSPSTGLARDVAACLQQGRLFYQAAASAPLEIRPLQQFYGFVGFAKALVTSQRFVSLSTLRGAHGISDVSASSARLMDLSVRIGAAGTFQEFNDVIASLNRFCYFHGLTKQPRTISIPTARSSQLVDIQLSLREILSRIPDLGSIYRMTFDADPASLQIGVFHDYCDSRCWELQLSELEPISDRDSVRSAVGRWRTNFPLLQKWRLKSATFGFGKSTIIFRNLSNSGIDEFSEDYLIQHESDFEADQQPESSTEFSPIEDCLSPLSGGYSGLVHAIAPVAGAYLSEYSLHYLALFLLSSLVRYRPQAWAHVITRSATSQIPTDDGSLTLLERFLDLNSAAVQTMIVKIINPHEDDYRS